MTKVFKVFISGFSRVYYWAFNNRIRTVFTLGQLLPRLRELASMSTLFKTNFIVNRTRGKERILPLFIIKTKFIPIIKSKEHIITEFILTVSLLAETVREKLRIKNSTPMGNKVKQTFGLYTPRVIIKLLFPNSINPNFSFHEDAPRIRNSWRYTNNIVLKQAFAMIRQMLRLKINHPIKITQTFSKLNSSATIKISTNVKTRFNAIMTRLQLYKLADWDYKIPDQPSTSPQWSLSELDNYTLDEMDIKSRITG